MSPKHLATRSSFDQAIAFMDGVSYAVGAAARDRGAEPLDLASIGSADAATRGRGRVLTSGARLLDSDPGDPAKFVEIPSTPGLRVSPPLLDAAPSTRAVDRASAPALREGDFADHDESQTGIRVRTSVVQGDWYEREAS